MPGSMFEQLLVSSDMSFFLFFLWIGWIAWLMFIFRSLFVSVIEKFTENTRFCIICNYLSKIIPALQSRCTRFRFGPLSTEQMMPRLLHIIKEERYVYYYSKDDLVTVPDFYLPDKLIETISSYFNSPRWRCRPGMTLVPVGGNAIIDQPFSH